MDNKIWIGMIVVATLLSAGTATYILDTGTEEVCRTGNGWEIVEDYGSYVYAVCPFLTKDHVYEYCLSEFRATSTRERYGCQKVILDVVVIEEPKQGTKIPSGTGTVVCYPESTGKGCEIV